MLHSYRVAPAHSSEPELDIPVTDSLKTKSVMSASLLRFIKVSTDARTTLTLVGRRCKTSHGEKMRLQQWRKKRSLKTWCIHQRSRVGVRLPSYSLLIGLCALMVSWASTGVNQNSGCTGQNGRNLMLTVATVEGSFVICIEVWQIGNTSVMKKAEILRGTLRSQM